MTREEIKQFKKFLASKRVLTMYKREYRLDKTNITSLSTFFGRIGICSVIGAVFFWDTTSKGFGFWSDLNTKWNLEIN